MMRVGMRAIDTSQFAESLHEFVGSAHRARKRAANADVKFPRSRLTKAGIKSHHLEHLDRFELKLGSHPLDGRRGDESEMMLHNVKQGQCGGSLARRVMRNPLVRLGLKLGRDRKRRIKLGARSFGGFDGFFEGRVGHNHFTSSASLLRSLRKLPRLLPLMSQTMTDGMPVTPC